MFLIIAGSRTINEEKAYQEIRNFWQLNPELASKFQCIVSGGARGVDRAGERFSETTGLGLHYCPAEWGVHGKAAGHIRNALMASYADALLLIWDGESRGSKNMKENMLKLQKPIYEIILPAKSNINDLEPI